MTQSEPTVFVADDDPSVIKGLRLLMKSVKLNVETYSSARDLLDSYNPDRPGCLLINMGSQNRLRVRIKRLYRENPNVYKGKNPVVFCNFVR
jgi:FixJ family two-component response regulator